MATESMDVGYVVSDKKTADRFAKGYEASTKMKQEKLPDAFELIEEGRSCLDSGLLGK